MAITPAADVTSFSQDWTPLADLARMVLEKAPTGEKMAALEKLAAKHGVSPDLLRRAVTAVRALEKMKAAGIAVPTELYRVPVGVVDVIVRWASYDRAEAFKALARYHHRDLKFRELMQAELSARPKGRTKRGPRRLDVLRAWKEACLDKADSAFREAGLTLTEDDRGLNVDAWARQSNEAASFAVLILGPHDEPERYQRERETMLLRALGVVHLGYPVVMVVPGAKLGTFYQEWLTQRSVPQSAVQIVGLRRPPRLADFM